MTSEKPEIDFPDTPPPSDLEVTDITEGDGPEAAAGQTVSVHYVGVAHSTGEEFDASYNRGAPLQFRLGIGQVIPGWDQGVQGMKVGGRRQLVIPPARNPPGFRMPTAAARRAASCASASSRPSSTICCSRSTTQASLVPKPAWSIVRQTEAGICASAN